MEKNGGSKEGGAGAEAKKESGRVGGLRGMVKGEATVAAGGDGKYK